jgi:hypothetical protein
LQSNAKKVIIQMVTGHNRGHEIIYKNNQWLYADNETPIKGQERPCKRCGCMPTLEGYDACLGHIDGAASACCGHGVEQPYTITKSERLSASAQSAIRKA